MTDPKDDLEAVRVLVATLDKFDVADRERIIRWAREKLGMPDEPSALRGIPSPPPVESRDLGRTQGGAPLDIKSFINQKNPQSDNHLAAVVAYFHHFHAPADKRKDTITKEDLIDACRKADRRRPARPAQVLVNAFHAGLLDKADRAHYRLNSVGENLVAMVLPEAQASATSSSRGATSGGKRVKTKKTSKKKARGKVTRTKRR